MARQARSLQKTSVFSVKQKTDEIMFRDRADRQVFVDLLESTKEKFGIDIFGYCLLEEDEFWILINVKERQISAIMQSLTICYALYRDDIKQLFTRRYKSKAIYNVEELKGELDNLISDPRYQTCRYCFYHPIENVPLPFISLVTDDINIIKEHSKGLNDQEVIEVIEDYVIEYFDDLEVLDDLESRNKIICHLYAEFNLTQKQLGTYFNLSNSSISKILKG